jgi:SAM-dependent methyltransferase
MTIIPRIAERKNVFGLPQFSLFESFSDPKVSNLVSEAFTTILDYIGVPRGDPTKTRGVHQADILPQTLALIHPQYPYQEEIPSEVRTLWQDSGLIERVELGLESRAEIMDDAIGGFATKKRVLDLGIGKGEFAYRIFCDRGAEVVGADISDYRNDVVRENEDKLKFHLIGDETLPFENNEFDVVYLNYVLHHAKNPRPTLSEAERVLKRNGKLILSESTYGNPRDKRIIVPQETRKLFQGFSALNPIQQIKYGTIMDKSLNDLYLKNHSSPCNFNTIRGWKKELTNLGLGIDYMQARGIDMSITPENHYVLVAKKR